MSLCLCAHGFENDLHIGYHGFLCLRYYISKSYSKKHGELYDQMTKRPFQPLSEEFIKNWNDGCDDDLDILIWHSDCDGRLTPKECTKVKNALAKIDINFEGREDLEKFYKDFVEMLKHCSKRRVIMYFC